VAARRTRVLQRPARSADRRHPDGEHHHRRRGLDRKRHQAQPKPAEDSDLTNFLGYENRLGKILPNGVSGSSLVSLGTESKANGTGTVDRKETVKLTVAAIVTQLLPNGNMVIMGSQEVRVNYEKRVLNVSGVVRPQDIDSSNTITHSQIAEARIAYGGVGQLSDVQQPRYGQQLFDVIFPF